MTTLTIATRKSPLALWQAEFVKAQIKEKHADLTVELLPLSTKGDKLLDSPLAKIGGKGLFVKELEQALMDGRADIAVHSMKDVPMQLPEGLVLGPILERHDPRDAFVSNNYKNLMDLPPNALVGSSSLRRICQIKKIRPDIRIESLRGNIHTRLNKLDEGQFDAIILAAAGLLRMDLDDRVASFLSIEESLPACGQGALSIELRDNDSVIADRIAFLNHKETAACVNAERALNTRLNGGCQVPIAGFATLANDEIHLRSMVASVDGAEVLVEQQLGKAIDAVSIGESVADKLLAQGAKRLIDTAYV
ncbi:MAG: hydroxymethylbilane synthase [Cellvibrionales bacterium]|nr:hydroxymethylbilane synthase [Cellvibrionales bacterium]